MENRIHIISLVILLIISACDKEIKSESFQADSAEIESFQKEISKKEITQTWNSFLNSLSTNNKKAFIELSNNQIRCYDCLENTLIEEKELENMRESDSLGYDKIYDSLIYVPINDFVKNDFDLIFNPEFVKILKEKKTTFHKNTIDNVEYYEVLVTTTEPTLDHEGGQHSFQFKKVNGSLMS